MRKIYEGDSNTIKGYNKKKFSIFYIIVGIVTILYIVPLIAYCIMRKGQDINLMLVSIPFVLIVLVAIFFSSSMLKRGIGIKSSLSKVIIEDGVITYKYQKNLNSVVGGIDEVVVYTIYNVDKVEKLDNSVVVYGDINVNNQRISKVTIPRFFKEFDEFVNYLNEIKGKE